MTAFETLFPLRSEHIWIQPGRYQKQFQIAVSSLEAKRASERIWANDATLWNQDSTHLKEITNRLGWLRLPSTMRPELAKLAEFALHAKNSGLRRAVHLGMGGSSLAPEVLRMSLGVQPGWLDLVVLDSTDPTQIRRTEQAASLAETLFIVASKSGTTAETANLYTYFRAQVSRELGEQAVQEHFCVITDPGTALAALANDEGLPLFTNPADIGGRFSALSLFGLLPAALLGLDTELVLDKGEAAALACGASQPTRSNPGLLLGALLGGLAASNPEPCDKLTLLCSPELESFGSWVEQLVAESTGKQGVGILPVVGEPLLDPLDYSPDRVFVALRLAGSTNDQMDSLLQRLIPSGAPCAVLNLRERYGVAGQFMLWEFATAVAGVVLGIDPFDQPDVESAKIQARSALARYEETHSLETGEPVWVDPPLSFYGSNLPIDGSAALFGSFIARVHYNGYFALMAYIDRSPAHTALLEDIAGILRRRTGLPVTIGYGPRFLHSTGQLHKGGPNTGRFIQLVQQESNDLAIPGRSYTFGVLKRAQSLGDLQALQQAGREVLCVDLGPEPAAGLVKLSSLLG